jgi:two-component system KDP operon response regulator KdpE/two-component system response regulator MprA
MKKRRLLVVDDDPGILESLQLLLEDAGYDVRTSTKNGDFVSAHVRREPPDLIILDILLSGHDGRTICRQLKTDAATSMIPIVLISAHPSAAATAMQAGADAFLAKPFDIDDLLSNVENLIEGAA